MLFVEWGNIEIDMIWVRGYVFFKVLIKWEFRLDLVLLVRLWIIIVFERKMLILILFLIGIKD